MLLYRIKICCSSLGPTLRYPPFFHHPRVKIAWFFAWEPPFQTWTSPISHGMSLSYVCSIHQLKHVETTFESCPKKNSPQWHNSPIVVKTLMNSSLSCGRPRKNCWLGVMACFSLLSTQRSRDLYKCFVSCSHMFSEFPIVSHGFRMFHHQMFPIFWPYLLGQSYRSRALPSSASPMQHLTGHLVTFHAQLLSDHVGHLTTPISCCFCFKKNAKKCPNISMIVIFWLVFHIALLIYWQVLKNIPFLYH